MLSRALSSPTSEPQQHANTPSGTRTSTVGFPRRDPEKAKPALEHTQSMLWVEHKKSQKPVAFARATGDGVFNAIIWDVVERLIEELLEKGIGNFALYSEPKVLGFYRPLGFVADSDGIRGMVYSRKQNQKKQTVGSSSDSMFAILFTESCSTSIHCRLL
ncbi:hypothetical protein F3Y22_tig00110327pilonHSYRG00077 [Hibiscus syriacus]|uniref:N-acetyltransferase domain-containing protein n=1 Tax=Hibiscus syriacus TaxID=106335 RepID=A0A6A3B1S3_HIBSY|nr:hypothetical protein F3Y22_tig00110327pilonHSYRG00077 [Hibiscus syriacus]